MNEILNLKSDNVFIPLISKIKKYISDNKDNSNTQIKIRIKETEKPDSSVYTCEIIHEKISTPEIK
jgi:hypothetical protein